MRVADRPLPPIVLHTDPELDRYPLRPVVAISGNRVVAEWDDNPIEVWDDPMLEWDEDIVPGFVDATCEVRGIDTESGSPDDHGDYTAANLVLSLDNSSGAWSRYAVDGTQAIHGPGFEVALWARYLDGSSWWIFRGKISRWDEIGDVIEVEAFDSFSDLAQSIGHFAPGVAGQTPGPRLADILTIAGRSAIPHRFDAGDVTLTAQATDAAPLEEMQAVASSDGGALFVDADGTLVYMKRNWRNGRTDQTAFPVASDNVCTAPIIVWDAILSTNDTGLADTVILQNVAKMQARSPVGAPPSGSVYTETDHQWTTQTEGDTLAALIQGQQSEPRVNVDEFDLYLYDPDQPSLYRSVEWRLLDVLRFLHDQRAIDGINRLDVNTLLTTIAHSITPNQWIMSIRTTKAMSPNQILVWNPAGDAYVWDSSGAVWGF